jgi:hypothetical protein
MAVRYALGAPLRPLVVTIIYNDPVESALYFIFYKHTKRETHVYF